MYVSMKSTVILVKLTLAPYLLLTLSFLLKSFRQNTASQVKA